VTATATEIVIAIMIMIAIMIVIVIVAEAARGTVGTDAAILTLLAGADLVVIPKSRLPMQSQLDSQPRPQRPCVPERNPVAGQERKGNGSSPQLLALAAQTDLKIVIRTNVASAI
jgi:hypothetical protein